MPSEKHLRGSKMSLSTISELEKKAYVNIKDWRNRPLQDNRYLYVYVVGIYLHRNWGGEHENVAIDGMKMVSVRFRGC